MHRLVVGKPIFVALDAVVHDAVAPNAVLSDAVVVDAVAFHAVAVLEVYLHLKLLLLLQRQPSPAGDLSGQWEKAGLVHGMVRLLRRWSSEDAQQSRP